MSDLQEELKDKRKRYKAEALALITRMMQKRKTTKKPGVDAKAWLLSGEGEALINCLSFLLQDCDETPAVKHHVYDGIRRIR